MGPCRVREKDRAVSIAVVGGSERETLLRPHPCARGPGKFLKGTSPVNPSTIVMHPTLDIDED